MASAEEPGRVRIKFSDTNESNPVTVYEVHSKVISGAATTYPTGETLKAQPVMGGHMVGAPMCKGRVVLYFVSDAADTLESEESGAHIPVLIYEDRGNGVPGRLIGSKFITFETMTGFTSGGTVDITCAAGVEQRIAYEDVPRGQIWALDPNGKAHVYMGDDTA